MEWKQLDTQHAAAAIAERLTELLSAGSVTWFVSGGSNIDLEIDALQRMVGNPNLNRLQILPVDERFGMVGHAESNWAQLERKGFMVDGPTYIAPFTSNEHTLALAVNRYEGIIDDIFSSDTYTYAQLGMGTDGHTAGILPGSVAAYASDGFVSGYEASPYERLTLTFPALKKLDEAILISYGENKWPQLDRLQETLAYDEQPVQVLNDIPRVTLYTDYSK